MGKIIFLLQAKGMGENFLKGNALHENICLCCPKFCHESYYKIILMWRHNFFTLISAAVVLSWHARYEVRGGWAKI